MIRGGLPPHPVLLSGLEISVRIEQGQEVPVQFVQEVRMIILVVDELIEHPGIDGRGHELPSVDAAVDPHGRLSAAAALANLSEKQKLRDVELDQGSIGSRPMYGIGPPP